MNIYATLFGKPELSAFFGEIQKLENTDIATQLAGEEGPPVTIFVPNNIAVNKGVQLTRNILLAHISEQVMSRDEMLRLQKGHLDSKLLVAEEFPVRNRPLQQVNTKIFYKKPSGSQNIYVGIEKCRLVAIVVGTIAATNGFIHVIDVMLDPSVLPNYAQ